MPPIERPSILQSAIAFERIGARIWPSIGGVMIVEARKQLSAPTGNLQRARASRRLVTVQAASRSAGQRKVGPGKA